MKSLFFWNRKSARNKNPDENGRQLLEVVANENPALSAFKEQFQYLGDDGKRKGISNLLNNDELTAFLEKTAQNILDKIESMNFEENLGLQAETTTPGLTLDLREEISTLKKAVQLEEETVEETEEKEQPHPDITKFLKYLTQIVPEIKKKRFATLELRELIFEDTLIEGKPHFRSRHTCKTGSFEQHLTTALSAMKPLATAHTALIDALLKAIDTNPTTEWSVWRKFDTSAPPVSHPYPYFSMA